MIAEGGARAARPDPAGANLRCAANSTRGVYTSSALATAIRVSMARLYGVESADATPIYYSVFCMAFCTGEWGARPP
jgi:hypothetical protein